MVKPWRVSLFKGAGLVAVPPGLDGNASEEFGAGVGLDFVEPDRDANSSMKGPPLLLRTARYAR